MYDLVIIGGGPAGMTAAVYAARKKMKTLMLTIDLGGQIMWTRDIENYMGYQYITGPELTVKFEEQVRQYHIEISHETVTAIEKSGEKFAIVTDAKRYETKTVIIASGKRPRRLSVPGEEQFTGLGVSYCATCDGPLFAGKTVAVVGGGNSALQAAIELSKVAAKVYLVARAQYVADPVVIDKLKMADNVEELIGYRAVEVVGTDVVERFIIESIHSQERKELVVQGVFVEIGLVPNSAFVNNLLDLNHLGEIAIDCQANTNVPGIFAAGDVTSSPDKQIVIAAGDGAKAALAAYNYLLLKK